MDSIETSYLSNFLLEKPPFEEVRDPQFFYESNEHLEALERLKYVINDPNMNFGLLTGEVGCGKSLIRIILEKQMDRGSVEICVVENSFYPFDDIIYEVLDQVRNINGQPFFLDKSELPLRGDRYGLMKSLTRVLETIAVQEKRHLVLLMDECQHLDLRDLDELKNLTNLSLNGRHLITLVLMGQPELLENIRELKQVHQRVSIKFHLNNLDLKDTEMYINHRLNVAGLSSQNIVKLEAIRVLFRYSLGVPREINRACKLALEYAFAEGKKEIDNELMKLILEDLEGNSL